MTPLNTDEFQTLLGLDDHEVDILRKAMESKDMSAKAIIKHWMRLGQTVDHFTAQGYEMVFRLGDEELDPFDRGSKLAPMPYCGNGACRVEKGNTIHHLDCPERGPGWA